MYIRRWTGDHQTNCKRVVFSERIRIGVSKEAPIFYFVRMIRCFTLYTLVSIGLMTFSCSSEPKEELHNFEEKTVEEPQAVKVEEQQHSDELPPAELRAMEIDEPPFNYPCDFDFIDMGIVRVSDSRWEEIQCGKGWDSRKGSCTWVYGEHIYNNFFPDSTVTEYRTHLVDLDSSQIEMTPEFLNSELFKSHLIVTTINGKDVFETQWDPNKTGKYQKPRQWIED